MSGARTKFYVDKANGKVSGVCAGIADYTGVEVMWIRIGTVLLTLAGGFPWTVIAYFMIAWMAQKKPVGLYESREDVKAHQVGIILNHGIGYSPDSLIGDKGLTEIKTKLPKLQVEVILADEIPKEHIAQCQGGLWVSEREWIDFVCYWPGMPLFIKRAYRDEAMIRKLSERVKTFYEILEDRMNQVLGIVA